MNRRRLLATLAASTVPLAGCPGDSATGSDSDPQTTTNRTRATRSTETTVPPPTGSVDFPEGPKERPERPSRLMTSAVREYVETHEYRFAFNALWTNEYSEVSLDCRVDSVTRREWGAEAVATCTGYSNTHVPTESTHTPVPHADWFTQSFRYRVSETATTREQVENREPVN